MYKYLKNAHFLSAWGVSTPPLVPDISPILHMLTGNVHHRVVPSLGPWNIWGMDKYMSKREERVTMREKRHLVNRQFL